MKDRKIFRELLAKEGFSDSMNTRYENRHYTSLRVVWFFDANWLAPIT